MMIGCLLLWEVFVISHYLWIITTCVLMDAAASYEIFRTSGTDWGPEAGAHQCSCSEGSCPKIHSEMNWLRQADDP
jgi:hypothetical protein